MLSGAQIIHMSLLRNNVKTVFCYSGGAIMPLIDKFRNAKTGKPTIKYYINNHEQNAGHSATGYAKSSGKTGVCVVTSGPGITNMITPILDATNDSTPLVVLSGQVPRVAMGTNAFQESPAIALTKPVTKWSYCVEPGDDLSDVIDHAFKIANDKKKGAVHIDLPKCILSSTQSGFNKNVDDKDVLQPFYHQICEMHTIINIILKSKKPLFYVGQGCNDASHALRNLVNILKIPITTTIHAMGCYNETEPLSLGFLGMHGIPVANYAMQNSDCIIALGSRFDDRTTGNIEKFAPKCKNIIHVNIEQSEMEKVIKDSPKRKVHNIHNDCKVFLDIFLDTIKVYDDRISYIKNSQERLRWIAQIEEWKIKYPIKYNVPNNNELNTQMVVERIGQFINKINKRCIVTSGVGNHQMMAAQFIKWTKPKSFISSGSLGVMGVGLPYAIGAQIAEPDALVIDIDGDGSFGHTLGDLQTIARYNLPVKIFIMNNKSLDMVHVWEKLFFNNNHVATDLPNNPNYIKLAESFGIYGISCSKTIELDRIIIETLNHDGPIMCDVRVNRDFCLPLVAPGKALDDMIMIDDVNGLSSLKCTGIAPS
jgi:acetolactate synthase-1/2/3 large subunit